MNRKQRQVLEDLISVAEHQLSSGECSTNDILTDGIFGLSDFSTVIINAIKKYYSSPCYANDVEKGRTRYAGKMVYAVDKAFIDYYKSVLVLNN